MDRRSLLFGLLAAPAAALGVAKAVADGQPIALEAAE